MRDKSLEFMKRYIESSREIFTDENKKLIHAAEFGTYRERLVKDFISSLLPGYYKFGEGFLVNRESQNSTQCDIIVYDENETPRLESLNENRFFPVETVYGIGEVKSQLSTNQLITALKKLQTVKTLRNVEPVDTIPINSIKVNLVDSTRYQYTSYPVPEEEHTKMSYWDPHWNEHQNIVSFLVCESIDLKGDVLEQLNGRLYEPGFESISKRHNFLLSLKDGLLTYSIKGSSGLKRHHFPNRGDVSSGISFVKADKDCSHVVAFLSGLTAALSQTCIYRFSPDAYMREIKNSFAPMGI